jgi:D-lactate dehydrogenase
MKIAFFDLEGWEDEQLKSIFSEDKGFGLYLSKNKVLPEKHDEANDCEIMSVFVNSLITRDVIAAYPNLKLIVTRSTGFDHIDLIACAEKNISVSYVPGYGDNTVAEHAFGLILCLTRKLYLGIDRLKETSSFSFQGLRGIDIKGKTIGIVGTGRIGKEMIRIAHGFGMNVIAFDLFPQKDLESDLNFKYVTLDELYGNSDVISFHVPYSKETHHLLNTKNIKLLKKGVYIINTARGGIIETEALVEALRDDIVAGAGMDVLEEEGEIKDEIHYFDSHNPTVESLKTMLENHILMQMPNVLITPHNAFNTQEALQRILGSTMDSITSFVQGKHINGVPKQ